MKKENEISNSIYRLKCILKIALISDNLPRQKFDYEKILGLTHPEVNTRKILHFLIDKKILYEKTNIDKSKIFPQYVLDRKKMKEFLGELEIIKIIREVLNEYNMVFR